MAQVFGCFKTPDAPLPQDETIVGKNKFNTDSNTVKETPTELSNSFQDGMPREPACVLYTDDIFMPGCDNTFVSHGRDLLSYYRFHVRGIENLLNHHDEVERRLKESGKSSKALADRLEKTEDELKESTQMLEKTEGNLASTLKELEDTQCELGNIKDQVERTLRKLSDTTDKLLSTEIKLEQVNDICNGIKLELKSREEVLKSTQVQLSGTQTELSDMQETYAKLDESYKSANERIDKLTTDLEEANKAKESADERADALQKKKDSADSETEKARKQLDDLRAKASASSPFLHHANRTRGDFYIDEVMYGGAVINNQRVLDLLLEFAVKDKEFTVTNDLMGGDPWYGVVKSFTAGDAVGGKGPVR